MVGELEKIVRGSVNGHAGYSSDARRLAKSPQRIGARPGVNVLKPHEVIPLEKS
jgi:hypothetical protein